MGMAHGPSARKVVMEMRDEHHLPPYGAALVKKKIIIVI